MFEPSGNARFDESEVRELTEAFEWGRAWTSAPGAGERYDRESKAAAVLGQSLFDASQGSWS
ncbi:MAG TPA: hypothetical protein VM509_00930, partial [Planctomycetota bacterium]|nr:hypothetical protein [Planctomycetota bacterium]